MATLSFAATGLITRSKTISASDSTRLLNAYRIVLGQVSNGAGGLRNRTDQETFDAFVDNVYNELRETVRNIEGDTAKAAVAPIALT